MGELDLFHGELVGSSWDLVLAKLMFAIIILKKCGITRVNYMHDVHTYDYYYIFRLQEEPTASMKIGPGMQ